MDGFSGRFSKEQKNNNEIEKFSKLTYSTN